jgi:hypothetical protein
MKYTADAAKPALRMESKAAAIVAGMVLRRFEGRIVFVQSKTRRASSAATAEMRRRGADDDAERRV